MTRNQGTSSLLPMNAVLEVPPRAGTLLPLRGPALGQPQGGRLGGCPPWRSLRRSGSAALALGVDALVFFFFTSPV